MSENPTPSYQARLERLERSLRRQRTATTLLLAAFVIALVAAAAPRGPVESVKASRVAILDKNGAEVAILSGEAGGRLTLLDATGFPLVDLVAAKEGGRVVVLNADGRTVGGLSCTKNAGLVFTTDAEGRPEWTSRRQE